MVPRKGESYRQLCPRETDFRTQNYVHEYAHLEYEQGYFVVDRMDGSKEVWRSSSIDPPTSVLAPAIVPDKKQRLASALANGDDDSLLETFLEKGNSGHEGFLAGVWTRQPANKRGEAVPVMGLKYTASIASSFRLGAGSHPLSPFGWVNNSDLRHFMKQDGQALEGEATTSTTSHNFDRLSPHFVPHMIIPVPVQAGHEDMTRAFR